MNENLVQWVLLREKNYLRECLEFDWIRVVGSNFSTKQGIIDFALECPDSSIHIVELETGIDSISKFSYCVEQTCRYLKLSDDWQKPVFATVLYADDLTSWKFKDSIIESAVKYGFGLKHYSHSRVLELYKECIKTLEQTSGLDIGLPVAMDVCYLYWINRIIVLFEKDDVILKKDAIEKFGISNRTGFNVRCKYCKDYELLDEKDSRLYLSDQGKRFKEAINPLLILGNSEIPLSQEQESIIMESLLNGRMTKCKANIFHFLRYVHLTTGHLIPHARAKVPEEYIKVWNTHLGTNYNSNSLTKFLDFTCNQCEELNLVERILTNKKEQIYSVVLTQMGSRILGYLELYLHLRREQIQIPLQIEVKSK